jgi:TRAP-type uncharacterized transport system substrate-binding protein
MSNALRVAFASVLLAATFSLAQAGSSGRSEADKIAHYNSGLVSIVTDSIDSQSMRYAADLAAVLDGEEGLRILPIAGRGPVETVSDILYLKGVDAGIVPSDVIAYMAAHDILDGIDKKLAFIAKLGGAELHIIARKEIASLADLKGKRVNAGNVTDPRFVTASLVFGKLGIEVTTVGGNEQNAVRQLKEGKADAIVIVAQQPSPIAEELASDQRFHLLAVPMTADLEKIYAPAMLSAPSYGQLAGDAGVETVSVSSLLAVFNWNKGSRGYLKLRTLAGALYSRIGDLQTGDRNAQWSEVNFASGVMGWTRYATADEWLAQKKKETPPRPSAEEISAVHQQMKAKAGAPQPAQGDPKLADDNAPDTSYMRWKESQLQ